MSEPLQLAYLLEDTTLFGGVKIVLHHATLLAARGHRVSVISKGEKPSWFPLTAEFRRVADFSPQSLPGSGLLVATFWTTIAPVVAAAAQRAVHYCQGFEAIYTHNAHEHPAILEAYSSAIPGWALAPHLAGILRERFGRSAMVVPPALAPHWRPRLRLGPRRTPRVLVVHPFENDWKGVKTALQAIALLRHQGVACRTVRVSQWPLSEAERQVLPPDEFHCHLTPAAVARLVRGADLMLAPSWEQEGFGLPVLEAMACGVPVVASDISAFQGFAAAAAILVPAHDPGAFASEAARLLRDRRLWHEHRRRGVERARDFAEDRVVSEVEKAIRWALAGGA
jgi:glycosyltransferase involved in cell wall biosynthesis